MSRAKKKEGSGTVIFRAPPELFRKLEKLAEASGHQSNDGSPNVNAYVRRVLTVAVQRHSKGEKRPCVTL